MAGSIRNSISLAVFVLSALFLSYRPSHAACAAVPCAACCSDADCRGQDSFALAQCQNPGSCQASCSPMPVYVDGGAQSDAALKVVQTSDGGLLVAGMTDYDGSGSMSPEHLTLIRLDASLNRVWKKSYDLPMAVHAGALLALSDDRFIVAGSTSGMSHEVFTCKAFAMKVDAQGNMKWFREYGSEPGYGCARASDLLLTPDHAMLLTGSFNDMPWAAKIDGHGNVMWEKFLGDEHQVIASAAIVPDNGFLFTGSTSSYAEDAAVLVIKTDGSGNIKWKKTFACETRCEGHSGYPSENRQYLIQAAAIQMNTSGLWPHKLILLSLNDSGKLINKVQFDDFSASGRMIPAADSGFVLAGEEYLSTQRTTGVVLKLDADLHLAWKNTFSWAFGKHTLFDITEMPGGFYAVAGSAELDSSRSDDLLVFKLDGNGRIPVPGEANEQPPEQ